MRENADLLKGFVFEQLKKEVGVPACDQIIDFAAQGTCTTATIFNPMHRLFRNGDKIRLDGEFVVHIQAAQGGSNRGRVLREDAL